MQSISIFGMGYVGAVTAACLASRGHKIIGVDPNPLKVQRIASGMSPIVEAGVQEMIASAHTEGLISATQDPAVAIAQSEISFISVGTPSQRNGKLDLSHIRNVCRDIGHALRAKNSIHRVVVRSTVLPGTTENVIVPAIESSILRLLLSARMIRTRQIQYATYTDSCQPVCMKLRFRPRK